MAKTNSIVFKMFLSELHSFAVSFQFSIIEKWHQKGFK